MYRLSLIIGEIYNKYLPLAEKKGISLSLDYPDTTGSIANPEEIKADLEKHLDSALSRSKNSNITIAARRDCIVISDSGTTLSKPVCKLLSNSRVEVKSRVGFGTTVKINLKSNEKSEN